MNIMLQMKPISNPSIIPMQTGLLQRKSASSESSRLAGECAEHHKKWLMLQRRFTSEAEPQEVPPSVHEVLRSPSQPLDTETRAIMEPRFGHDFSRVQVHPYNRSTDFAKKSLPAGTLIYSQDYKQQRDTLRTAKVPIWASAYIRI